MVIHLSELNFTMNKKQRLILVIGAALAVWALAYPVFEYTFTSTLFSKTETRKSQRREFLLDVPYSPTASGLSNTRSLLYGELFAMLSIVGLVTGVGVLLAHAPAPRTEPPNLPSTPK